jgi:hypothetical protein
VNLASHLVRDALTNVFDVAVVLTNDTDLIEPIRIVREEAGKIVGLLSSGEKGSGDRAWPAGHRQDPLGLFDSSPASGTCRIWHEVRGAGLLKENASDGVSYLRGSRADLHVSSRLWV